MNLFFRTTMFVGLLAHAFSLEGQVLYGTLLGTVTDASGAVVASGRVSALNSATGQTRETETDLRGFYAFRDLQPGAYQVRIIAGGFAPKEQSGINVTINTTVRLDMQLQLANISESVSVSASVGLLQTDRADVHTDVTARQVTNLPLTGYRNYQSLLDMVPGATPSRFQNAQIDSPQRSLTTNINGTSRNTNNTRIDGATSVFPYLPHHTLYVPPAESIETVNVSTNSFDAEQGMAGGAAINVITKSGTNEVHGSIFEFHNNNAMAARNFFWREARRPKNIQNQFGGTLGGPIVKDKLFYFGSYEGMRQRQNYSSIVTVPTEAQRNGDFSGLAAIYDPLSGDDQGRNRMAFPGNQIPPDRQSGISRKMQSYVPLPNLPGDASNYFASAPVVFDRHNADAKINWNISDKSSLWGKYSMMESTVIGQPSLGEGGGTGLIAGGGMGTGHTLVQVAGAGFTRVITPTLLFDANFGFSRLGQNVKGADYGTNFGTDVLGIPGTNGPDPRQSGQPSFRIGGYEVMGNGDAWMTALRNDNVLTYVANLAWTKGAHNIRFGADLNNIQMNDYQPQRGQGPRGGFEFAGGVTGLNAVNAPATNQFNSYAAFLLGMPSVLGKSFQVLDPMTVREWSQGLYFRDQWQATRNLTVTLGVRWEYYPIIGRTQRGIERYDLATNKVFLGSIGNVPSGAGTTANPHQFAPRLGLAYRLGSNTVLRAGFGISVDPYPLSRAMRDPYPVTVAQDFRSSSSFQPVGTLEQGIPALMPIDLSSGTLDLPLEAYTKTLLPGEFRRGYVESFNFMVQRQLPGDFSLQAGYVGTRTIRQTLFFEANAGLIPGAGAAGQPLNTLFGRRAQTQVHLPFRTANYNSLQVKLDRRFSSGVTFTTAYTWSKSIDWSSDSDAVLMFHIPSAENRNRAVSNFDRTHVFQAGVVAELPFGRGKAWFNSGGFAGALLSGWQTNARVSAYTGLPFTVTASGTSLNAPFNTQVADQTKPEVAITGGIGNGNPYFDRMAFAPVTAQRLGNAGRNAMRGPGLANLDASVFRTFRIREKATLQFRAEAMNATNTPHFNNPANSVNSANFGYVTSALDDQRVLRVALRLGF